MSFAFLGAVISEQITKGWSVMKGIKKVMPYEQCVEF
jgi:hypothetical protein